MRHRLDHIGTGDEHVGGLVDHQNEVGDRRGINSTSGTRSHDRRDLRDHAARQCVAQKNVGIPGQRHHAFLNARASGVVQADHRRADAHRGIHDLHNLAGVSFGERSAEDGEILREDKYEPALNASVAGDETVAEELLFVHPEIGAAMGDELVGLLEGAFVEEKFNSLARRHLACFMLAFATIDAATSLGKAIAAF